MKKKQSTIVKEYKFDKTSIHKIYSLIDNCYGYGHNILFQRVEYKCVYSIKVTNIRNNETVNLAIADKSMTLYELIKKLKIAQENGFIFNQINKLLIKIYSYYQI